MNSHHCLLREGLLASLQDAIRGDGGVKLVYVHGVSGVGKTELIDTALTNEGLGQNREAFFFDRPVDLFMPEKKGKQKDPEPRQIPSKFKNYLNNLILIRRTRLPLLYRIFSRDFRMEDAHLSINRDFSFALTVSNRDGSKMPRVPRRGNHLDVNLTHGRHRLNGTVEVDFFEKLWSGLRLSGCRHVHIGNIEYATEKEREYIFLLAQFTPEDCCLILEFGTLVSDGSEDGFRRNLESLVPSDARRMIRVDPFDESTAREFHRLMSQGQHLPAFDYWRNKGIPICILNEISIVESRYSVGGRIKKWLEDSSLRRALLAFVAISSVTENHDTIALVLADVAPRSSLSVFSGVVEVGQDHVRFSHASFPAYLEANHRLEIQSLVPEVITSLARLDRFAAHALRLGRGAECSGTPLKEMLVCDVMDLFDDLSFPEILHLFNAGAASEVAESSTSHKILAAIQAFAHIHDLDHKHFRPSSLSELPWPIADMVSIYADYQFDRRNTALAKAESLLARAQQELLSAQTADLERFLRLIGVAHVMIGSSLVGLGRYRKARDHFREAGALTLPKLAKAYLRVLDGFNDGIAYQADLSPYDPPQETHPYIAAKIAHNIIASRIELMRLADCRRDLWETSINPLEMMGSREFTYGLNNIAVIDILENDCDSALRILRYLRDKAYQAYDFCACENNVLCCSIVSGRYDIGAEACGKLEHLFKKGAFSDPTFRMMTYSNIAAFAWRFGDVELKHRAFDEAMPPPEHESSGFYNKKLDFMRNQDFSGTLLLKQDGNDLENKFVYYPVVLHHWDFYIPPVNSEMLKEWIIPQEAQSSSAHD